VYATLTDRTDPNTLFFSYRKLLLFLSYFHIAVEIRKKGSVLVGLVGHLYPVSFLPLLFSSSIYYFSIKESKRTCSYSNSNVGGVGELTALEETPILRL
jgi:hypothetical protein